MIILENQFLKQHQKKAWPKSSNFNINNRHIMLILDKGASFNLSYLMQSKILAYRLIMFFSFFTILGIYYFEFLNLELISTKLLLAQLYLNIIAVIAIYFMQSLQNIKIMGTK